MAGLDQNRKIKVLYVDDEYNNLMSFKATFRRDFDIYLAGSAREAMNTLTEHEVDIVISDQRMPEMTGVEFLEYVKEKYPLPMRMMLTGYADIEAVVAAINRGQIYRYITKPWDEHDLKLTILQAFEVYTLREENRMLVNELQLTNEKLKLALKEQDI